MHTTSNTSTQNTETHTLSFGLATLDVSHLVQDQTRVLGGFNFPRGFSQVAPPTPYPKLSLEMKKKVDKNSPRILSLVCHHWQ